MPAQLQSVQVWINALSILVALACVFWGLTIFKVYVVLCGMGAGAVAGTIIGALVGKTQEAAIIGLVVGMIIGGAIAWPLQRLMVALLFGAVCGFLGAAAMAASGAPRDTCLIAGSVFFLVGAIVAGILYEHYVVIVMGFNAANGIAGVTMSDRLANLRDARDIWEVWLRFYAENLAWMITLSAIYVTFAWLFQKGPGRVRAEDDPEKQRRARRLRSVSYLVAAFVFAGYFASLWPVALDGRGRVSLHAGVVLGFALTSWPVVALLLATAGSVLERVTSSALARFIGIGVLCVTAVPLVGWAITSVSTLRPAGWTYYLTFVGLPPAIMVAKWALAVAVFPGLVYLASGFAEAEASPPPPVPKKQPQQAAAGTQA